MSVLRFVAVIALAAWVGGLTALGAVGAPAIFDVLEARDPAGGRELAAQLFGTIFERFQYVSWGLALVVLISLGARAALGPRPRRFAIRMWVAAAMLATSLTIGLWAAPRIDAIRTSVDGSVAALPDTDARKIEFGRLHGLSSGSMIAIVLAGAGLIWLEISDPH